MPTGLLTWIERPSAKFGLRFLEDSGDWTFYSFEALRDRTLRLAGRMADTGAYKGDVICIFLPTGPEFFSAVFATWTLGGTICPLVPPLLFEDETAYLDHVSRIVRAAKPRLVVSTASFSGLLGRILAAAECADTEVVDVDDSSEGSLLGGGAITKPGDVALLQFTSGSSGTPRGVQVSFENLESNIDAIRKWFRMTTDDVSGTWLPLYHDMGLIGCLLTPTVVQGDVWIMRPDQFVRDPLKWIECYGKKTATLSAAPNFGYGFAARRINPDDLDGMDFSRWRVAIVGAEPIDAHALTVFSELLAPFGFAKQIFLPAYGLAEATLAVTGGTLGEPPAALRLDWDSLAFGESVKIAETGKLNDLGHERSSGWLVTSGKPHPGVTVAILDEDANELPDDTLGEILVNGPSVARGYSDSRPEGATRFTSDGLVTGDAGFIHEGELYVVGRMADSIKVRGRTVYAEDLETRLADATELRRGRFVVIAMPGEQGGSILTIAEEADEDWATKAVKVLRGLVGEETRIRAAIGDRGSIQRTSSGKPRRRVMWQLAEAGQLVFRHIVES